LLRLEVPKIAAWKKTIDASLPHLLDEAGRTRGRGLIIGATVLSVYHDHRWITKARSTGDLDISIGLVSTVEEYSTLRDKLIALGYRVADSQHSYRLYSPVKQALEISYVDLLCHPEGSIPAKDVRTTMGVGPDWSFSEIDFSLVAALEIAPNIVLPNPLGFLNLKRASYVSNPKRVRDLIDIADVVFGLVDTTHHYDLTEIWPIMLTAQPDEARKLESMVTGIMNEEVAWDFRPAKMELEQRGYTLDDVDERAPALFREFWSVVSENS
jgi:hypothetical protein